MFALQMLALPVIITSLLGYSISGRTLASNDKDVAKDSVAATVEVQNDRTVPAVIYVERGDEETKLGVVDGLADHVFTVPVGYAAGEVRFFIQPKGQLEESTPYVELQRGERVGVVVKPR